MKSFYMDREDRVECVREEAGDLRRRIRLLKLGGVLLCLLAAGLGVLVVVLAATLGLSQVFAMVCWPVILLVLMSLLGGLRSKWETLSEELKEREEFLKGTKP